MEYSSLLYLHCELKNGGELNRCYSIHASGDYIPLLRDAFSKPKTVFSDYWGISLLDPDEGYEAFLEECTQMDVISNTRTLEDGSRMVGRISDKEELRGLMEAMLADCREGTMSQHAVFHNEDPQTDSLYVAWLLPDKTTPRSFSLRIYASSTNTQAWLAEHIYTEEDYGVLTD